MRTVESSCVLGAVVLVFGMSVAHAAPVDCEAARCAIASEIEVECPCSTAVNHGRFTSCVARVVNRAAREGRIPKPCRGEINGCYLRSLCGKPPRAVLCDQPGAGPGGRCRPLPSESECTRKGGDVVSTCCASCGAPTPTPSVPGVTPTPGAPTATNAPTPSAVITATGAPLATATPTPLATSITATATSIVATATPIVATATPVPATVTPIVATVTPIVATATPIAATATAAAPTPTPAATITFGIPTALATVTPVPTLPVEPPTPTPFPFLFVGVEAEPDAGPPPLRVQWTSDVSGGTPPYTYRWIFGDGSPDATTPHPVHVYDRLGDFTTTLIVEDSSGLIESDDWDVTVEFD
jgi:hypothetical protein